MFWLLFFIAGVVCQNTNDAWYVPGETDGPILQYGNAMVFQVGSTALLNWTTSWTGLYSIELWQQNLNQQSANNISIIYSTPGASGPQTYAWTVSPDGADLTQSNTFYLNIRTPVDTFNSFYFNMTTSAVAPTSSASTSTTSATSTSNTASTASTTSDTSTASNTASATSSGNTSSATSISAASATSSAAPATTNDTATKVGLGVGLGVGIPLIIALAAIAFLLARKKRGTSWQPQSIGAWQDKQSETTYADQQSNIGMAKDATAYPAHAHEIDGETARMEMSGISSPVELAHNPEHWRR